MGEPVEPFYQTLDGIIIPGGFGVEEFRSCLNYKPKPGELFVVSYPKCGTTWLQTIVFLICNRGKPLKDAVEFFNRMPFMEMTGGEFVENAPDVYAIKHHLPFQKTPYSTEAKYIYITRNPKDTVVSFFHHTSTPLYLFEEGEFDVYFELYINGKVDYGDFFDHTLGWYKHHNDSNVLFLTYEELKADTRAAVLKIARFMGEEHVRAIESDPEVMENVIKHSSVEEMKKVFNKYTDYTAKNMSTTIEDIDASSIPSGVKKVRKFIIQHRKPNPKVCYLVREGKVGGWRGVLKKDQAERMDKKIEMKLLGTELYKLWKDV